MMIGSFFLGFGALVLAAACSTESRSSNNSNSSDRDGGNDNGSSNANGSGSGNEDVDGSMGAESDASSSNTNNNGTVSDAASDASGVITPNRCAAQDASADDPNCRKILGIFFDGSACVTLGGCNCVGTDCDSGYDSIETCERAHGGCLSCEGAMAAGAGDCDQLLGSVWDGEKCVELSGCNCDGDDCDQLVRSLQSCYTGHQGCATDSCDGSLGLLESEVTGGSECRVDEDCIVADNPACGMRGLGEQAGGCFLAANETDLAFLVERARATAAQCVAQDVCDCPAEPRAVSCTARRCVVQ